MKDPLCEHEILNFMPRARCFMREAHFMCIAHFIVFLVEKSGFEPLKAKLTDLQSVPFGQLGNTSRL